MFYSLVVTEEEARNNIVDFLRFKESIEKIFPINKDEYIVACNGIVLFDRREYCYLDGYKLIFIQDVIKYGDCITLSIDRRIEEINII